MELLKTLGSRMAFHKPRKFLVRCLGHGDENWFMSWDKCRNRLCDACAARNAEIEDWRYVKVNIPKDKKHKVE